MKTIYTLILVLIAGTADGQSNLPACKGSDASKWNNCLGTYTFASGTKYVGEFKDGKRQREQAKQASRISISASATQPDAKGEVTINIQTNTDTSSL